jgi:hypothetical protein
MENGTTTIHEERKAPRTRSKPAAAEGEMHIAIKAPDLRVAEFELRGTAPYVQFRFPQKAIDQMKAKHEAGSTAKGKKVRDKRDFDEDYRQAIHLSREGWPGIPANAFRCAMIDSCRLVGFHMTLSRMSVFVLADGVDPLDGTPLIRIEGEPQRLISHVRNEGGVADLRARAIWHEWSCKIRVRYDADQFTIADVTNLIARAGMQVGIGEGRPFSKKSNGMGWGTFEVQS